mmetsp:Transcript_10496/g.64272  ORF Transcript_10496/g.64272 Transcript_10496/m.64272 type:complete len:275 (-) Transcript_10496:6861-7685(-)
MHGFRNVFFLARLSKQIREQLQCSDLDLISFAGVIHQCFQEFQSSLRIKQLLHFVHIANKRRQCVEPFFMQCTVFHFGHFHESPEDCRAAIDHCQLKLGIVGSCNAQCMSCMAANFHIVLLQHAVQCFHPSQFRKVVCIVNAFQQELQTFQSIGFRLHVERFVFEDLHKLSHLFCVGRDLLGEVFHGFSDVLYPSHGVFFSQSRVFGHLLQRFGVGMVECPLQQFLRVLFHRFGRLSAVHGHATRSVDRKKHPKQGQKHVNTSHGAHFPPRSWS